MNIRAWLEAILDAILPRRERQRRTEKRAMSDIPLSPGSHQLLGTDILTVLDYREPAVEDLLQSLKYDASGHAALLCAELLEHLPPEFRNGRVASVSPALLRTRPTKQQTRLSREERLRNVAGAFELTE